MNEVKEAEKGLIKEFAASIEKLYKDTKGDIEHNLHPAMLTVASDLGSIVSALDHLERKGYFLNEPVEQGAWTDDIKDELDDAEKKYRAFKQSNDPQMLEMSREELSHAAYYLNHAKMSTDQAMRERLPEYQDRYDRLEKQLREPHGKETIPKL